VHLRLKKGPSPKVLIQRVLKADGTEKFNVVFYLDAILKAGFITTELGVQTVNHGTVPASHGSDHILYGVKIAQAKAVSGKKHVL
jgi:hypothetical protein